MPAARASSYTFLIIITISKPNLYMKNYRAIIVEDERLPRLSLIRKLETYHPDIEIVDCCESYETALTAILRHRLTSSSSISSSRDIPHWNCCVN